MPVWSTRNLMRLAALLLVPLLTRCNAGAEPGQIPTVRARWEQRAPMPESRTEVSVATDGELIYVIGGFKRESGETASAPRAVFVYDPARDQWTSPDSIPEGVNHAGLVHLDGKLYIVGGYRENTFDPTGAVHIYDLATRRWSEGAPMPTPRGAMGVTVLGGKIHAIGGTVADPTGLEPHLHGTAAGNSVGTHEVYDPATDTWSRRAPMPTARNHLGAASLGGKIYALAGRVPGNATLTANEVYDPGTDRWATAAPVPTGRSGVAVVALGEYVYIFGGETFGAVSKTFDEAERYRAASGRWESLPRMPTARHGLGAAAVGGAIYVISGGPQPGFAFSGANERLVPAGG
ncbi:MAG: galactose oxidase [Gemmatimonadetes bacterium]|nr:galactose oxidase [Gemmatimonadota bacterium]